MFYQFPIISRIEQVLPHIDNNFSVQDKGDYTVINYNYVAPETFPEVFTPKAMDNMGNVYGDYDLGAAIRRECRGLIFDKHGDIIRRPFHKFFNYRERVETQVLNLQAGFYLQDKLDGSMLSPFIVDGDLIWGTKQGYTQVAETARGHINKFYENFARKCITMLGATPIFEWCTRKQRIVLDYEEDELVLTAIRHMKTGLYFPLEDMEEEASQFGIPTADIFEVQGLESADDLVHYLSDKSHMEGMVLTFDNGHKVKFKTPWYVEHHKAKNHIENDRNIIRLILSNGLDDLKPLMQDEDREKLEKFERDLKDKVSSISKAALELVNASKSKGISRKDFAIDFASKLHPSTRALCFKVWDKSDYRNSVEEAVIILSKSLSTETKYEDLREAWLGGLRFN